MSDCPPVILFSTQILEAVHDNGGHDTFYGQMYVGLWYEAHGQPEKARAAMTLAVQSPYAQGDDYMAALAKVHMLRRNW